ncbi:hypothetical protein SDC9_21074 [bioreactor metagenome]|uniref:Uncharacterized protein n=1 Tax=bioreactor metagenome TaxID=1076179 RepID=A0A644U8J6_9ZZZZ
MSKQVSEDGAISIFRVRGSRVQGPHGPAAVREESFPIGHWETGKTGKDEDAQVRKPACFMPMTLRAIEGVRD